MLWLVVGSLAAILTMFSFLPQVARSLKTRSVSDLSPVMLLQLSIGVSLWIVYGVYLRDTIIIIANAVTLICLSLLLFLYFKFKGKAGGARRCRQ